MKEIKNSAIFRKIRRIILVILVGMLICVFSACRYELLSFKDNVAQKVENVNFEGVTSSNDCKGRSNKIYQVDGGYRINELNNDMISKVGISPAVNGIVISSSMVNTSENFRMGTVSYDLIDNNNKIIQTTEPLLFEIGKYLECNFKLIKIPDIELSSIDNIQIHKLEITLNKPLSTAPVIDVSKVSSYIFTTKIDGDIGKTKIQNLGVAREDTFQILYKNANGVLLKESNEITQKIASYNSECVWFESDPGLKEQIDKGGKIEVRVIEKVME
ncbi:MAG: hypothetical protein RSE00_01200 [Clostridia bacterium]